MVPEFQLLRGDLLLALGDGADPESWSGDGETAGAQLRAVHHTFSEGFTTADLTEARALLETDP
jgi:hypothetical protein